MYVIIWRVKSKYEIRRADNDEFITSFDRYADIARYCENNGYHIVGMI